jgi:hypothetical protein
MRQSGLGRRYAVYAIILGLGIVALIVQRALTLDQEEELAQISMQHDQMLAGQREQMRAEVKARQAEQERLRPERERREAESRARQAALAEQKARQGTIASLKPEVWRLTILPSDDTSVPATAMLSGLAAADPQKPPQHCDILAHEIVRQAWLIALREGLGVATRDESLGESLLTDAEAAPDSPSPIELEVHARVARDQVEVALLRSTGNEQPTEVWRRETPVNKQPAVDYMALMKLAEQWSRDDFVEALKQQGVSATEPPPPTNAGIDAPVAKRLCRLNVLDQFLAIRELHQSLREQGASPQIVGGLVRAYANLGLLTEFHWSQAHKAMKARAALYAQRLCREQPGSPWGLWHRSYACALTGLHKQALDDLESAARLAAQEGGQNNLPPPWIELIDAYCHFDAKRLDALAPDEELAQLTGMLQFLASESRETPTYTIKNGMAALRQSPENFRIIDMLCDVGGIGHLHQLTEAGPAILQGVLLKRLPQTAELPDDLAKSLKSAALKQTVDEARLVEELAAAGRADRHEPCWAAFAQIVSETQFVHVWRRGYFLRFQWSVPAEEYLQQSWPLVARHRHRQYLQQILYDVGRPKETAADLLSRLDQIALPATRQAELARLLLRCGVDQKMQHELLTTHSLQCDEIYSELAALSEVILDHRINELKQRLEAVSPHGLQTAVCQVLLGKIDPHLEKLEREGTAQPLILKKIATRLYQPQDSVTQRIVLRQYIELSPDYWAYRRLADIYKDAGDVLKWKDVLDEYLDTTEPALEHARVRTDIALDFMSRQQWQRAEPYAAEAARSYAAWAMHCAVQCYEGMGDLKQAQLWFGRLAQRYPRHAGQYAAWCKQHGLEAPKDLGDIGQDQLEELFERLPPEQLYVVAAQFLLRSQWESALSVFQKAHVASKDARSRCFNGMFTVLMAEQLHKPELRDQTLRNVADVSDASQARSKQVAQWMQQTLAAEKDSPLGTEAIDALLQDASVEDQVNLNYFVARFLELRGHINAAQQHYAAAAGVAGGETFLTHRLAKAALEATPQ